MCPIAATTPRRTSSSIASRAPGRSGAMVTTRIAPSAESSNCSSSTVDGSRRNAGFWAPQRSCDRYGPSKWMPASTPSATSGANALVADSISSNGELTRLASIVVVPRERWNPAAFLASSASPVVKVCPPPPCTWMSTKPGSSQCRSPVSSSRGGPSDGPGEGMTARICSSSMCTSQESMTPFGVTTRPVSLTRPAEFTPAPPRVILLRQQPAHCPQGTARATPHRDSRPRRRARRGPSPGGTGR